MQEIEPFLTTLLGKYVKKMLPVNGKYSYTTSYSLPLFNCPTIDIVIISPFTYEVLINDYALNNDRCFYYFLYDKETDMIVGNIVEIEYDWDWKQELAYYVYTSEERLEKCECPVCSFWLIQRANIYGHKFIGCSGFPDCTYSIEISRLFN